MQFNVGMVQRSLCMADVTDGTSIILFVVEVSVRRDKNLAPAWAISRVADLTRGITPLVSKASATRRPRRSGGLMWRWSAPQKVVQVV